MKMVRHYSPAADRLASKQSVLAVLWLLGLLAVGLGQPQAGGAGAADSTAAADTAARPAYRIVQDGPVRLSAKLLPVRGKLTVGDRFELELTVRRPRSMRTTEPLLSADGDFAILERKTKTRYQGDTIVDVHRYRLAAFATGEVALPPFLVIWQGPTERLAAASETLRIEVASVLADSLTDINDLKPQVQFPNYLPLWIILGVVGIVGLALLGRWLVRRYRRIRLAGAPLPDPWTEALAALDAIPVDDWLGSGQVKRYYYAVSEILKRYLGRRFGFPAPDQTTTEIAAELKARKVPEREGFCEFFRNADLVKYAKFVPAWTEMTAVLATARELVRATTPAPEPAATGEKPQ